MFGNMLVASFWLLLLTPPAVAASEWLDLRASLAADTKVDTHHHYVPDFYAQAVADNGGDPSGWPTPQWSSDSSLELMSTLNIRTAILSLTAPGASISPDSASLARKSNEFASNLTRTSPSRFGFFAALPDLFDTAAVLEEIAYSFDVLGADGVTLFTRYGEGHYYLGHAAFEPIWKELDRREAVVFIHPTHPVDTALFNPRIPQPVVDYPHETTRTAVDMIVTGTKRRYSKCTVILSHAGGTLPFLIGRVAVPMKAVHGVDEGSFMEDARSFFYDLALSSTPGVVRTLLELVGDTQILYGSDFPYAPRPGVVEFASQLDGMEMSEETRRRIGYENALGLFPRLARILREEIRESGSGAGENTATKVSETGTHEEL